MKLVKKTLSVFMVILTLFTMCSVVMPVIAAEDSALITDDELLTDTENELSTEDSSEAEIVSEIVEKRGETTKQFLLSDGSFKIAQYNNPVHYQNENGEWIDIDNTLSKAEATEEQIELFGTEEIYSTQLPVDNVLFAEKSNSNTLVSFEAEEFPISLNYQSAKKSYIKIIENTNEYEGDDAFLALSNVKQEVLYENVFNDVDLQYIVSPSQLKENIILKSKNATNYFTVNYNIGELTAEAVDEHTVNLKSGSEVVYTIAAPYMYDADGKISYDVSMTVEKNKNGKLRISLTADESWLKAAERVFPVVVDPSIVQATEETLIATYVSDSSPNTAYGEMSEGLIVSYDDSYYGDSYTLIKLTDPDSNFFADHIVSAKLCLPVTDFASSNGNYFYAYEISETWDENNVTWNTKPSLSAAVTDFNYYSSGDNIMSFDITKLYYKWQAGEANNGIALTFKKNGYIKLDANSDADNGELPIFIVNYINTTGIDEEYSYSEFDMGSAGYVYVNNLSGNLAIHRDEIDSTGENYPYDLSTTFNGLGSVDDDNPGWLKSFDSVIYLGFAYLDEDGSIEALKRTEKNEDNSYELAENKAGWEKLKVIDYYSITVPLPMNNSLVLTFPDRVEAYRNNSEEKYLFDLYGLCEISVLENGEYKLIFSKEYTYNSDGSKNPDDFYIIDGDGDKLHIQNNENSYTVTQMLRQSSAEDDGYVFENGDTLIYTKDADGNTTQITLNNDVQAVFTYDDLSRMTSITNNEGYKLSFDYDGENRCVSGIAESRNGIAGQQVSYERGINYTTARTSGADGAFGNSDDLLSTYKFNTKAKLISVQNKTVSGENLGTVDYEHSGTNTVYGSVSKVSAIGQSTENLLLNHNMESTSNWSSYLLDDKDCVRTAEYSTQEAYVGAGSLKISVSDVTAIGGAAYYQHVYPANVGMVGGKTYTLSGYVKTSGTLSHDADAGTSRNYGAAIMVKYAKADGSTVRSYSQHVQKTYSDTNNGWERVFTSFTLPENCERITVYVVVRNCTGTAYFDAVQLEEGDTPNQYNMLENNSFTYSESNGYATAWQRTNLQSGDKVSGGQFKITGTPGTNRYTHQEIMLSNASQDDTYSFGGWVTADAVPLRDDRGFAIKAAVAYLNSDGSSSDEVTEIEAKFNYYDSEKQFASASFNLKHKDGTLIPSKITITVEYNLQCNTAYFDDIALYRTSNVVDLKASDTQVEAETDNGYVYNEDGTIQTYTDENGVVYVYNYDSLGNLIQILGLDGTTDLFTYAYYDTDGDGVNDSSDILSEIYSDGTTYTYEYNSERVLIREVAVVDGVTTTTEYDNFGKIVSEISTDGTALYYTYDSCGNLVSVLDSDGDGDTYEYIHFDFDGDEICDRCEIFEKALASGATTCYNYNDEAELTAMYVTENGSTLVYNYDSDGRVIKVTHNGFNYNYEYDAFGNPTAVKVGNQNLVSYGYTPDKSKLKTLSYGNESGTETYTYNAYGEVIKKSVSGVGNYQFKYDTLGNIILEQNNIAGRRTYYLYDKEGKPYGFRVNTTDLGNAYPNQMYMIRNSYNDDGNIIAKRVDTDLKLESTYFDYNDDGLVSQVATSTARTRKIAYTYDEDSRVTQKVMSLTSPITEAFGYNDDGFISTHTVSATEGTAAYGYTYDDKGNITEITKGGVVQQSYVYDDKSQLVRENNRDLNKSIVYSYDGYGNILSKTEYAFTTGELGAVTDTVNYTYDTAWKDKLTSYDGQSITYDAIGNPTTYKGATLTWNGRQLASYTKDGLTVTYKYDANGLRTQKTVNGVVYNYGYEDGKLVYEQVGDDYEINYRYDKDGNLFTYTRTSYADGSRSLLYAVNNTRGDLVELRTGSGAVYAKYNYDSWGNLISVTNANGTAHAATHASQYNSIRYRGYVYDRETGLYYLQSRYYDPETGRFLNADDVNFIGASGTDISFNAFTYCYNNSVNCADYFGFFGTEGILAVKKITGVMATLLSLMVIIEAASAAMKTGSVFGGLKTGVIAGAGVLILSVILLNINNSQVKTKNVTRTLPDVKAKQPTGRPYKLAYVNDKNELIKYGKSLSLKEVLILLGFAKATDSMYQSYRYDFSKSSEAQRTVQPLGFDNDSWGVYAKTQEDAKTLALILGCTEPPEVHGSGMYGHYHNSNKSTERKKHFHVWYGIRLTY